MTPRAPAAFVLFVLLSPAPLLAQTLTGTITGTVADERGKPLPGARVTLVADTGPRTQQADAAGRYRFPGLASGTYSVRADHPGLRSQQREGIALGAGRTIEIRLRLTAAGADEAAEVQPEGPVLDTSSTATGTTISQALLFEMPVSHLGQNVLEYTPGVISGSAFGAPAFSGNALPIDGVDTRDPAAGTAWMFYDYNIVQEVQASSLGLPAEYGGYTGMTLNTVTKSGGNRFAFLGQYRYTDDSPWLFADNTSASLIAQNPNLASPARILRLNDCSVQLGGPIRRNKAFFFADAQRRSVQRTATGPIRSEVSPRFNAKVSWQPTAGDAFAASVQYDQYNTKGVPGPIIPGWAASQDQTQNVESPETVWTAQYRRVFNPSTLIEAGLVGYSGSYASLPVTDEEAHWDALTAAYSGGAGTRYRAERTRNQANVSLSRLSSMAGSHALKFGVEIERSATRDQFAYSGRGVFFYDLGGPYIAYGYTYDLKGANKRESYYAQDQWRIRSRLTANLGLRLDHIRGEATATGQRLYDTTSLGPRLGAAWDVSGRGSSVLKASWGKLYQAAMTLVWSRAVPGLTDTVYYEVGPNWATLTETGRDPATMQYSVDTAHVRHPYAREWAVAWEQALTGGWRVTTTGIWRDWHNFTGSVLAGGKWTARSYQLPAWNGPGNNPIEGTTSVPIYRWANPGDPQFVIRNIDEVNYAIDGNAVATRGSRRYRGLMLVVDRPLRNRWQLQASWVLSKTEGTVGNGPVSDFANELFETPNGILVNAGGRTALDRRHQVRVFGGYRVPKIEVGLNAFASYLSGAPYAAQVNVGKGATGWSRALLVNAAPRGTFETEGVLQTALRIEKVVRAGIHRFGVYADIQNVFNAGTVTANSQRYPFNAPTDQHGQPFKLWLTGPLAQMEGRQVTLGARWTF